MADVLDFNASTFMWSFPSGPVGWTRANVTTVTGGTTNLTAAQSGAQCIDLSGVLVSTSTVVLSSLVAGWYGIIKNNTTGNFVLTFKGTSGTGVVINQGKTAFCWSDGTNIYSADNDPDLTNRGTTTKAMADTNQTLTFAECQAECINTTGAITANRDITIVSAVVRNYFIVNSCTGAFGVRVFGPSGTSITIANVKNAWVRWDGTNMIRGSADV